MIWNRNKFQLQKNKHVFRIILLFSNCRIFNIIHYKKINKQKEEINSLLSQQLTCSQSQNVRLLSQCSVFNHCTFCFGKLSRFVTDVRRVSNTHAKSTIQKADRIHSVILIHLFRDRRF